MVDTAREQELTVCERLVLDHDLSDPTIRQRLSSLLVPLLLAMTRESPQTGSLSSSEDHVRNIATALSDKLTSSGAKKLRTYSGWRAKNPTKTFGDWLRIVNANAIRDYARAQFGRSRGQSKPSSVKRWLNELRSVVAVDEVGVRPPNTDLQTAQEVLKFAQTRLASEQMVALELWLSGSTYEEIDARLQLTPGIGLLRVRAAVATLRRHFGQQGADGNDVE